ncbi:hypothetical protein BT93_L4762 [Corymbia citriodora subsp. variegata]|uniref:Uncharacterized protein n=1 Tax=Corymbia citriodora subsp. variegata TaxID=360336 RepID=A0A8T0CGK1_CORYI|nr:hypothetical protein BT93_L4762 [Corymbia citriodora subsp. variegata]
MPLGLRFPRETTLLHRPIPSSTHLTISSHHRRSWSPISRAASVSAMAVSSVRVAAAQMTSINDLAANFATCSRLVQVTLMFSLFFPSFFVIVSRFLTVRWHSHLRFYRSVIILKDQRSSFFSFLVHLAIKSFVFL